MERERSTQQVIIGGVVGLVCAGVIIGLLLAAAGTGVARWMDKDQRILTLERDGALQGVRVATTIVTEGTAAFGLAAAVIIGLIWMERRSRQIYPQGGLYPLIRLRQGEIIYDPNRGPASSPAALIGALEVQRVQALATAAEGLTVEAGGRSVQILPAAESPATLTGPAGVLPAMIQLTDLFQGRQPDLNNLVVGVGLDGGQQQLVTASIHDLMHTMAIGASGWGKSTWVRQLIWQIAQAPQGLDVIAIDVSGSEFNLLRDWDRLRFPVARSAEEAESLLGEVRNEIARRRAMWETVPLACDLPGYNKITGNELSPWLVVADEATNLLNQGGIGRPLREVAQTARQYGIYLLLAGQSARSDVVDTQTRDQFSTRVCFRIPPSSSRVVLDDRSAAEIQVKGRAVVQLVGKPRMEVQAPYCTREELAEVLQHGGPSHPAPAPVIAPIGDRERRVWEMHDAGASDTAIAREVFGYGNPHYIDRVRAILQQQHKA